MQRLASAKVPASLHLPPADISGTRTRPRHAVALRSHAPGRSPTLLLQRCRAGTIRVRAGYTNPSTKRRMIMAAKRKQTRSQRKESPDIEELLVLELQEIHSAETQLARVLPRLVKSVRT